MNTEKVLRIRVSSPAEAAVFLVEKLHLFTANIAESGICEYGILLKDTTGNEYLLTGTDSQHSNEAPAANIIYTDDCLKDYFYLTRTEVLIKSGLRYGNNELTLEIADGYGNLYVLTETRDCEN